MEFKVPQFIDLEDQIFGPFTWKQFLFILAGGGGGYAAFVIVHVFPFNFLVALAILGAFLAIAFFPKERFGKPFSEIVEASVKYYFGEKLYTWKKLPRAAETTGESVHKRAPLLSVPGVSHGKLSDKSWNMTVGKEG